MTHLWFEVRDCQKKTKMTPEAAKRIAEKGHDLEFAKRTEKAIKKELKLISIYLCSHLRSYSSPYSYTYIHNHRILFTHLWLRGKAYKGISVYAINVISMGRMDIIIPDDLEKRFREEVFKRRGMKRGNMTWAIQEAIEQWIEQEERKK